MKATITLVLLILSAIDSSMAVETEIISINEGEPFELKCATNLHYPVVWYFQQTHRSQEILLGGEVSIAFQNMFRLTGNQSLGEYNLYIKSVDGRYVGNYKCIDDEGLGAELLSIQINIIASTSATDMVPIAELAMGGSNYEAPKVAASSSENKLHSNSINIPAVACGVVVSSVVIVVTVIIVVAKRKWCTKRERKSDSSCHRDVEAQPRFNPDASETLSPTETSPGLVMEHAVDSKTEELDSLDPVFPQNPIAKRPAYYTQSSDGSNSSRKPLLNDDGEKTPEI